MIFLWWLIIALLTSFGSNYLSIFAFNYFFVDLLEVVNLDTLIKIFTFVFVWPYSNFISLYALITYEFSKSFLWVIAVLLLIVIINCLVMFLGLKLANYIRKERRFNRFAYYLRSIVFATLLLLFIEYFKIIYVQDFKLVFIMLYGAGLLGSLIFKIPKIIILFLVCAVQILFV